MNNLHYDPHSDFGFEYDTPATRTFDYSVIVGALIGAALFGIPILWMRLL